MSTDSEHDEWKTAEKAFSYLRKIGTIPHRAEGEKVLLEQIPTSVNRVLDLATGSGQLLSLVKKEHTNIEGIGLDYSETMIFEARKRFRDEPKIEIIFHDLREPLPDLGKFDLVISGFAIHHLVHERKRELYDEVFHILNPNGMFCNFDHVSSPAEALHLKFLKFMNQTPETEDRSNKLLDVETQLRWLREIGFADVDCCWKWMEFALLIGSRPGK
jgi:tRNA (cmo5U34)-methyltransferase